MYCIAEQTLREISRSPISSNIKFSFGSKLDAYRERGRRKLFEKFVFIEIL